MGKQQRASWQYGDLDNRLRRALEVIREQENDVVELDKAPTELRVIGKHPGLDAADNWEQVWGTQGLETLPSSNLINTIVSTDAGDAGRVVEVEGFQLIGGLLDYVKQTAVLNGLTDVTLTTPLARVVGVRNNGNVDLVGTITVRQSVAGTVHLTAPPVAGLHDNRSFKAAASTEDGQYWLITELAIGVSFGTIFPVEFAFQIRRAGKAFITEALFTTAGADGSADFKLDSVLYLPPNSDFRVLANVGNGTGVPLIVWATGPLGRVVTAA